MTYDELLARIAFDSAHHLREALRAVVELHKCSNPRFDLLCDCGFLKAYPCPTIRAIEAELK